MIAYTIVGAFIFQAIEAGDSFAVTAATKLPSQPFGAVNQSSSYRAAQMVSDVPISSLTVNLRYLHCKRDW